MILAIDVGNTNIVLGGIENGSAAFISRLSTDTKKTEDEYAVQIKILTELNSCPTDKFTGAIISSVVPQIVGTLKAAVKKVTGHVPMVVSPGLKTGLDIKIDNPAQLGSDLVVGAVAAAALYPKPFMVIDMGTATTICAVDKKGCYRGGIIVPGVRVAMESLTKNWHEYHRLYALRNSFRQCRHDRRSYRQNEPRDRRYADTNSNRRTCFKHHTILHT